MAVSDFVLHKINLICLIKLMYLICNIFLKVNNFTAGKGKSFLCRVFREAEMILYSLYVEFHVILLRIFSKDFLHSFF